MRDGISLQVYCMATLAKHDMAFVGMDRLTLRRLRRSSALSAAWPKWAGEAGRIGSDRPREGLRPAGWG